MNDLLVPIVTILGENHEEYFSFWFFAGKCFLVIVSELRLTCRKTERNGISFPKTSAWSSRTVRKT
jgi:hypothetical protein